MNKITKTVAVLLAAATMSVCAAGCADTSWSYKDSKTTVSIGTYIAYMFGSYYTGTGKVENKESEDILSEKIKNNEDKEVTVREFVLTEADTACKNYLLVEKMFADQGLKITDEEMKSLKESSTSSWASYGKTYKEYGISEESFFNASFIIPKKSDMLFKAKYGKDGPNAVADKDIEKYFTDNYTDYGYFSEPLANTTADQNGNATTSVPKSAEEIKAATDKFNAYADMINKESKTFAETSEKYTKDNALQANPATVNTENLKDSSIGEDLVKEIGALKEGEAKVVKIGEDSSATLYLLYKGKVAEKVPMLKEEASRNAVLSNMKGKEFTDYMTEQAKAYKCEKNEAAIKKYTPDVFAQKDKENAKKNTTKK